MMWLLVLSFAVQQPAGFIAGAVVDADTKRPVARARVLLARTDAPLRNSVIGLTDDSGSFTIRGVLLKSGGFIAPSALTKRSYPAVYFPGTTDMTAAQSIEVRAGGEVYGIDLRLVVR